MLTKKKSGDFFAVALFALLLPLQVMAKVDVKTTIQPNPVEAGESFQLRIDVSGDDLDSVAPPQPPNIPSAQFISQGKSQRVNSFTFTNDQGELQYKTVRTQVYTYTYVAEKNGTVMIPPVAVKVGDEYVKTSPASLKVLPQGQGGGSRFQEDEVFSNDPFEQLHKMEDQFNQLLQRRFGGGGAGGFQAVPPGNEKDAFLIVAEVDKTTAYKGEQITATWYLYTQASVREIDTLKYPELKGFWKEDIELATLLNFQPMELKGKMYNRALLASYALFPLDAGNAVIDPYRAKVTVAQGFARAVALTKNSESIPVLVKPLPAVPANTSAFSGAVGEFQIKADVDSGTLVSHQPFSLRVHVEGRGNAKQFELPSLNLPDHVEVYDIKKDSKFFKTGMSYKDFEVLLIPRQEGELILPPIKTTVFNPRTEKYEELSTQEIRLNVMQGSGPTTMAAQRMEGAGKESEEALNLITQWQPSVAKESLPLGVWWGIFAASFFGLLLFAGMHLGWFKKDIQFRDRFEARLKQVHRLVEQKKWREVGVEATNLAYLVLGDISGQGGANLPVERLLEKCPPSVRREVGEDLRRVMDKFYLLGFGPDMALEAALKAGNINEDLKKLENLLNEALRLSA